MTPDEMYREVFQWGRDNGWHVSTMQARALLQRLGVHCDVTVTRDWHIVYDIESPAAHDMIKKSLVMGVWMQALDEGMVPLEPPRITEEREEVFGVPGTKYTVHLRTRITTETGTEEASPEDAHG